MYCPYYMHTGLLIIENTCEKWSSTHDLKSQTFFLFFLWEKDCTHNLSCFFFFYKPLLGKICTVWQAINCITYCRLVTSTSNINYFTYPTCHLPYPLHYSNLHFFGVLTASTRSLTNLIHACSCHIRLTCMHFKFMSSVIPMPYTARQFRSCKPDF